jgi:hypothetical protein
MALDTSQRLEDHTVAELRQMARDRGIKRYSKMKKAELVKALQRAGASDGQVAGDTTGDSSARLQSQPTRDPSTGQGHEQSTLDHDEILAWANARNAVPATAEDSGEENLPNTLCFRFPWSMSDNLRLIDWPTWFRAFENFRLRFIYLVPADGRQTNDFQLQSR